jgi:hypothetical protein
MGAQRVHAAHGYSHARHQADRIQAPSHPQRPPGLHDHLEDRRGRPHHDAEIATGFDPPMRLTVLPMRVASPSTTVVCV